MNRRLKVFKVIRVVGGLVVVVVVADALALMRIILNFFRLCPKKSATLSKTSLLQNHNKDHIPPSALIQIKDKDQNLIADKDKDKDNDPTKDKDNDPTKDKDLTDGKDKDKDQDPNHKTRYTPRIHQQPTHQNDHQAPKNTGNAPRIHQKPPHAREKQERCVPAGCP
jgi:hypothetical protein